MLHLYPTTPPNNCIQQRAAPLKGSRTKRAAHATEDRFGGEDFTSIVRFSNHAVSHHPLTHHLTSELVLGPQLG